MPTPETPQQADPTDAPAAENGAAGAPGADPWERMPEDALNVPSRAGAAEDGGGPGPAAEPASGEDPAGDTGPARQGWTDFLPSPVLVLLLGLAGFAGWLSWQAVELDWVAEGTRVTPLIPPLLILLGWIVSCAVHEFGHALAAYLAGDRSLRGSGYLRLNPFAYREAFGGLVLPVTYLCLSGLGLTGPPAYVDWDRIPGRGRRVLVALAGPLASLAAAALLALTVSLLVPPGNDTTNWAIAALAFLSLANLTAAAINLLPLPGLDGFEVLAPWLPGRAVRPGRAWGAFGSIAVFAVLWFPSAKGPFTDLFYGLFTLVLPNPAFPGMAFHGELLLQFWG
ncbi:site-2 protease family protein [Nocardiopsis sp. LOL_012]|uniref:site-2 protease family protein n=1 Tax=Nocardiopsis sp. LOL_012 TaxID=3345409 RepID=UPI003A8A5610